MSEETRLIHSGIMCRECFRLVDLTALRQEDNRRNSGKLMSETKFAISPMSAFKFELTCPYCGEFGYYNFSSVKPLQNWRETERRLNTRMDTLDRKISSK